MISSCVEARRARPLLGTFVEVLARAREEVTLNQALAAAFGAIAEVQDLMSAHNPASELGRSNCEAFRRKVPLHSWTREVLRAAIRFSRESAGAFDVAAGSGGHWSDILLGSDGSVRFARPLKVNLGGIAKGFAVDRAIAALKDCGATSGLVNAGGDLRVFGDREERVAIRHPLHPGRFAGQVLLRDGALATSARYFADEVYHGRTGGRLSGNFSATVLAADCLTADALTKVALCLREKAAPILRRHHAEGFLLEENNAPRWLPPRG